MILTWKKNIDDIKIICKNDGKEMILETSLNLKAGIFVCPHCKDHINLEVK